MNRIRSFYISVVLVLFTSGYSISQTFTFNGYTANRTWTVNAYEYITVQGGITMTARVTHNANPNYYNLTGAVSPNYATYSPGSCGSFTGLWLASNRPNLTPTITLELTFSPPVCGPVTFNIGDLNGENYDGGMGYGFRDEVTLTVYDQASAQITLNTGMVNRNGATSCDGGCYTPYVRMVGNSLKVAGCTYDNCNQNTYTITSPNKISRMVFDYSTGNTDWGCNVMTDPNMQFIVISSITAVINTAATSASPATICTGQSSTISTSGGVSYLWSNGSTSASQVVSPVSTTTYTVTVTDAAGCSATGSVTVNVSSASYGAVTPISETTCDPSVIQIGTNPSATGATSFTYSWYSMAGVVNPCPSVYNPATMFLEATYNNLPANIIAPNRTVIYEETFAGFTGDLSTTPNADGWRVANPPGVDYWSSRSSMLYGINGNTLSIRSGLTSFQYTTTSNGIIAYDAAVINASYYTGLILTFDWRCAGQASVDYGEVVYSVNGGASWTNLSGAQYQGQSFTQTANINASVLDGVSNILLGVRWTSDNVTFNRPPFAIDNIRLSGIVSYNPPSISSDSTYVCIVTINGGACNGSSSLASNCSNVTVCALPVELLKFQGTELNEGNLLFWSTATENNNEYFEIQRSSDAHSFTSIGKINGNGNTNQIRDYRFIDNQPLEASYYRLKQVDFDGKFSYSNTIFLKHGEDVYEDIRIWPVPSNNDLFIGFALSTDMQVLCNINDITGRLVLQNKFRAVAGENVFAVNIASLQSGLYYLNLFGATNKTYKIIKK